MLKCSCPPGEPARSVQMPVWNAVYQVSDFSQYVNWVKASDAAGNPLPVTNEDKSLWRIEGTPKARSSSTKSSPIEAGPYRAQLNDQHGFFNFAEILMYPVDQTSAPLTVSFADVAAGWKIACALQHKDEAGLQAESTMTAWWIRRWRSERFAKQTSIEGGGALPRGSRCGKERLRREARGLNRAPGCVRGDRVDERSSL